MNFLVTFLLSSYFVLYVSSGNTTSTPVHCDVAKKTYRDAGYKDDDIYDTTEQTGDSQVCGLAKTCCMKNAERNLLTSSERKLKGLSSPLHHELKEIFQETRIKLKGMFGKMINESEVKLDSFFKDTYQSHYTNNAYIFSHLYKALQQYINGSELDLKVTFNTFFGNLNEKIYVMFKAAQLKFDEKYKNCIKDNTYSIRPFGSQQELISFQLTRAFEASRVFLLGLKEGMEVTKKLLELPIHEKCKIAFMKMTHCSICSGINPSAKPCKNYCLNIMKGCYAYILMIQPRWNAYIDSMTNLVKKIEGPFNMEALIVPLEVKLSDAIMAFRDRLDNTTRKVESICGKVNPNSDFMNEFKSRKARSADDRKKMLDTLKVSSEKILSSAYKFESKTQEYIDRLKEDKNSFEYPKFMLGTGEIGPTDFENLLSNAKKNLKALKDYWFLLPGKICSSNIASGNNTNCWNGQNIQGYAKKVVSDSALELFTSNPEMSLIEKKWDNEILKLDLKLRTVIGQISSVIEGNGIKCVDCESSGASGDDKDGSGGKESSGEGSGENVIPTERPVGSGDGTTTESNSVENNNNNNKNKNNNNGEGTETPCNPNDQNCIPQFTGIPNEGFRLQWVNDDKLKHSSSYSQTTNLALLLTAVAAYLIL